MNKREIRRKYIVTHLVFFIAIFFITSNVQAITYRGIGGRPANPDPNVPNSASWFIYNLDLNEEKEDLIVVQNTTLQDERVIVYAADSLASTDGGFALKQQVDAKDGIGKWIRFYPFTAPEPPSGYSLNIFFNQSTTTESILEKCAFRGVIGINLDEYVQSTLGRDLLVEERTYIEDLLDWCGGVAEYEISIPTESQIELPFVISIPKNAAVGEHTGGIVVQKIAIEKEGGNTGIRLTTRLGVRVYQTVPGEILRGLEVSRFDYKYVPEKQIYTLSLALTNSGNVSQEAALILDVVNSWPGKGDIVFERKVHVLRDDTLVTNFEWPRPSFGNFTITPRITYNNADGDFSVLEPPYIKIVIIPWFKVSIVAGLLVILLVSGIILRGKKKKYRSGSGWVSYTVKKGETLSSLAHTFTADWRKIAAVNRLKKPYFIEPGEKLLLPPATRKKRVRAKR